MDVKQAITSIVAAHKVIPLANAPQDAVEPLEILSERTETAKVFDAGKGQRTAHIYVCPIHWKDTDGSFKSIDPTVKRKPLSDPLQTHKYETKSGLYHAHFKDNKPHDYRLEIGDSWIEYEALFVESESLTIDVETSRVGVKETITLKDEKAPTRLSWKVTRSGTGIITPPPVAADADGKPMVVKVTQNKDILIYEIDTTNAVFPIIVDPTSVIATNDAHLYTINATYITARDAPASANIEQGVRVGQMWLGAPDNIYIIDRSFLSFAIPDMIALTAASQFLFGSTDQSTQNFDIRIHTSTYSTPAIKEDFDQFDGWRASGAYNGTILNNTWNSADYIDESWNEIVFIEDGISAIFAKKNDTFKMVLISKEDDNNSPPTFFERVTFYDCGDAGKEPYLSITYTVPQNITEAVSALLEMEASIPRLVKSPVSALIEMEAAVTAIKARIEAVSALLEVEANVGAKWEAITAVSALIELEASVIPKLDALSAVSALLEVESEVLSSIKSPVSALIEVEASVTEIKAMITAVSALIEMEASVTALSKYVLSLGGSMTPVGGLITSAIFVVSIGGSMTPSGGISITNPDWIPIDDRLRWLGEWSATRVYVVGDVVMYKTAEGRYHGWLSRTTHNVGNIPTTAYAHWARIVQAKWNK